MSENCIETLQNCLFSKKSILTETSFDFEIPIFILDACRSKILNGAFT